MANTQQNEDDYIKQKMAELLYNEDIQRIIISLIKQQPTYCNCRKCKQTILGPGWEER